MADKKVGIQLVAIDEEKFQDAMRKASEEVNTFSEVVQKSSASAVTFGTGWERAFNAFRSIGATPLQAIQQLNDAVAEGIEPQVLLNRVMQQRFDIVQNLALQGKDWNQIQKEMNELADKNVQSHSRLSESAIHTSRAFFALTLASFGLMTIEKELKQAFGEDLPPAFQKTISGIQEIASFGSAGAFIGDAPGAIIGGITGAVLALGSAAISTDPQIQKLNQSLDQMSKKDDLVNTLSQVLHITKDEAQTLQDAASKNSEFAKRLDEITKAAEPQPPLLVALKVAWDELSKSFSGFNVNADGLTTVLKEVTSDLVYVLTLFQQLQLGQSGGAFGFGFRLSTGQIDIAKALADAEKRREETLKGIDEGLKATIPDQQTMNGLLQDANAILDDQNKQLDKAKAALDRYNQAIDDANQRLSQLNQRTAQQRDAAQQQYQDAIDNANRARQQADDSALQQRQDRLLDLWTNYNQKLSDINQQQTDRINDINMRLGDQLFQIDQDLANKKAELLHQYQDNVNKANDSIKQAAEDLARKLYEIERQRIESIQQLDFNTALQLETAQTDHDRDRILRQRQFELAQINQKANDARSDAEYSYQQKVEQAQKERTLARNNYEYELALAERLAEQKREQARRTAEEQIAQAQREANQARAIAAREYEQQKEIAIRAYNEQVAANAQAEQNKLQDATRALAERNKAIDQSYALERQQIEYTKQKALDAYREVIAEIKNMTTFIKAFMQAQLEAIGLSEYMAKTGAGIVSNLTGQWAQGIQNLIKQPTPLAPNVGGASGMDMVIPQGYPNDTYMIGASSGERVTITPANTYNSSARTMNVTIPVYDASDPQRTAQQIKRILNDVAFGMG